MAIGLGVNIQKQPNKAPTGALGEAIVNGSYPKLLLDFNDDYYATNGGKKLLGEALTHSRSGNATMVDSDGLLKWAPHNLLTYSEAFDQWSYFTAKAATANSVIAPDGTQTADTLEEESSGSLGARYHPDYQTLNANEQVTYSAFMKKGTSNYGYLTVRHSYGNIAGAEFNLDAGTVSSTNAFGNCTLNASSITSVGNGWYRCSISATCTASTTGGFYWIGISDGSGIKIGGYPEITLSGKTIYAWGAHLYRSDLGGMVDNPDRGDSYVPTTSSAVYLPRRGHHVYNGSAWVNEGLLHESEARTNLVPTGNFSDSAWTKDSATVDASAGVGPDGVSGSAYRLNVTAGSGDHQVFASFPGYSSGDTVCNSVFIKRDGGRYTGLSIYWTNGVFVSQIFDLETGALGDTNTGGTSGTLVAANAEYFGNGWWRLSVAGTSSAGTGDVYLAIDTSDSLSPSIEPLTGAPTYTAVDGNDYLIFGPQLEIAPTPSSYIPTAGATVTRAAETLTIPSANLPWPTPQVIGDELVTNGTFDTDLSGWSANNAVISASSGQLTVDDSANAGAWSAAVQQLSLVSGKVYRATFDVVSVSGSWNLGLGDDATTGDVVLENGSSSTGSQEFIFVADGTNDYLFVGVVADGVATFDNISVREINPLSVSIQMDGRMTYADTGENNQITVLDWAKDLNNSITCWFETNGGTGRFQFRQEENGTPDDVFSGGSVLSPGILVPFNIASRHGSTFINGAVDGVALTADTTPTALPDLSSTDLNLGYDMMGTIKTFRIWDKDLGDTGIEEASS